jgi:C1A family cysteine protease
MKLLLLFTNCISLTNSFIQNHYDEFDKFQLKFKKTYSNSFEYQKRFLIFSDNLDKIMYHNFDIMQNFTLVINFFSDLTSFEFKSFIGKLNLNKYGCDSFNSSSTISPKSLDWRDYNVVTPVKNQGQCGSCWAFSATGAIESSWAISKGELINLSEQELVDCATGIKYGGHGCNGGQMDGAFKYVEQFGLCSDIEYPYSATQTSCTKCEQIVYISSCYDVKSNDQLSLKNAVAISPVSVAIEADTFYFQSYSGGILDSPQCGTNLDHGVLIVGYGTENRLDYWIVKNSWGENWGMNGYVKILKSNSTNDPGICGIAIQPSFPII